MPKERDEMGRYVESATLDDVLNVFDRVAGPPVVTSGDVADATGLSHDSARRKLETLVDQGRVDSRRTAGRKLYWRTSDVNEERREAPGDESVGDTREPSDDVTDAEEHVVTTPTSAVVAGDSDEDLAAAVREYLEENDLPPRTDHGRSAVVDVFRILRERGTVKTAALQAAVHPAYADEWATEHTMWNAIDRYLEDVPGVEKSGYGEWGYAGDDAVREDLEATDDTGVTDSTEEV